MRIILYKKIIYFFFFYRYMFLNYYLLFSFYNLFQKLQNYKQVSTTTREVSKNFGQYLYDYEVNIRNVKRRWQEKFNEWISFFLRFNETLLRKINWLHKYKFNSSVNFSVNKFRLFQLCQLFRKVFRINIATVIGPTPPSTGVIWPATFSHCQNLNHQQVSFFNANINYASAWLNHVIFY